MGFGLQLSGNQAILKDVILEPTQEATFNALFILQNREKAGALINLKRVQRILSHFIILEVVQLIASLRTDQIIHEWFDRLIQVQESPIWRSLGALIILSG